MRIAVWHNLPTGGGKRALYSHVQGLLKRGHYVESWCPPSADQTALPLSRLIRENICPLPDVHTPRIYKFKQWLSNYDRIVDRLRAIDRHCQQCAKEIAQGEFDVLFANSCTFFYNTPIGKHVKLPGLIYLQEPYRWLYEALPRLPWTALESPPDGKWTFRHLRTFIGDMIYVQGLRIQAREEFKNARAYKNILVNSLFSRESVLRAYGLEANVCYLGIDEELFAPTHNPRENFVIGLGGIYIGKRIERSIEAIGTIPESERPVLMWIGNFAQQPYLQELKALAERLKVTFIIKIGISDSELIDLLSRAAAMIYLPYLEPFGLAPLEANACGTAVVAIAEGGVRETVQNGVNGFLIQGYDPAEIGKAISKLVINKSLADEMGKRARQYVLENWTLKTATDRLEQHLFNLVGKQ